MKYKDLIEFCALIVDTEADESLLAEQHVRPNGYIERVLTKVLESVRLEKDFDYRTYLAKIIENPDSENIPTKRTLN